MSKLEDLDVDRVDAVGDPATGRRFLILKSEDGNAAEKFEQVKTIVKDAGTALVALAKSEIELPLELAAQFTAIAKSLELGDEVVFKSAPVVVEDAAADTGFKFSSAEEASALIVKSVTDALPVALRALLDGDPSGFARAAAAFDELRIPFWAAVSRLE